MIVPVNIVFITGGSRCVRVQRDREMTMCCTVGPTEQLEGLMSLTSHVQELKKKHRILSEEVEEAQRNPGMDALRLSELKRRKLKLKEEITRLSGTA